jgi:hypothetical protein
MAFDYLSIPGMCSTIKSYCIPDLTPSIATSVNVEHVFSKGRLVLSHVWNVLSVQSTCILMCLRAWSKLGLVKDRDVMEAAKLPDVNGSEAILDSGWDDIV